MYKHTLIVIVIAIIIIVILALLRRKITTTLYKPKRKHKKLRFTHTAFENLLLNVRSGKIEYVNGPIVAHDDYIHIWHVCGFPGSKVVLYFHGNSDNISHRRYMIQICNHLKLNIILVDYRGYGMSGGKPSSTNVLRDAEASYNFARTRYECSQIVIWGESLGGTPACHVASKYKVNSLILLSTFTSLHSLIQDKENPVRDMAYWVLRSVTEDINEDTNNISMISKVTAPVLILHSTEDKLIHYRNAVNLVNAINHRNKTLVPIKGGHASPHVTEEDFQYVLDILNLEEVPPETVRQIVQIIDNLSMTISSSATISAKTETI